MGRIIQAQCAKCDFQKNIYAGGGLRDCELPTILSALPEEERQVLAEAVSQGAVRVSIYREPSLCESCGAVYALPVVEYTLNGERKELWGLCPQCGENGSIALEEHSEACCPQCGGDLLLRPVGHWD